MQITYIIGIKKFNEGLLWSNGHTHITQFS